MTVTEHKRFTGLCDRISADASIGIGGKACAITNQDITSIANAEPTNCSERRTS